MWLVRLATVCFTHLTESANIEIDLITFGGGDSILKPFVMCFFAVCATVATSSLVLLFLLILSLLGGLVSLSISSFYLFVQSVLYSQFPPNAFIGRRLITEYAQLSEYEQ